jgi:hypothetical protein
VNGSTRLRCAALTFLAFLLTSTTADAQIGGLIKRKATEAVKGPEKKTEEKPADNAISLGDVRELNATNLDALIEGLKTEIALREAFRAEVAKYPTREQYNKCQQDMAMSPESQKLLALLEVPEKATAEQMQAATKKFAEEGAALLKKKCPLDPEDVSDYAKQKRLGEIEGQAAAAAARKRGGGGHSSGGPFLSDDSPGVQQDDKERLQYSWAKERVLVLCAAVRDPQKRRDGAINGLRIPGTGVKIFWVFTAEEVKGATPQKCDEVMKLMDQLK